MMEWLSLLVELLERGITINIQIQAKPEPVPTPAPPRMIPSECKVCGWFNNYPSIDQAKKGLNARRQHCTREDCPKYPAVPDWYREQVQSSADE